jgi:hypothetical protein
MSGDTGVYVYLQTVGDIINVIRAMPAFNQLSLLFHMERGRLNATYGLQNHEKNVSRAI